MTKQEEIREGLIARLEQILKSLPAYNPKEQAERLVDEKWLPFLDSKGVAIKVDRELPHKPIYGEKRIDKALAMYQKQINKAGYVAVEPLIKEEEIK